MWFKKHYSAVGDVLSPEEYGPHLHPDADKPSPSLSNLVAVYRPPWPISPLQTGSVLSLRMFHLCKLHEIQKDLPLPNEDFCAQLPWALIGNRTYNLPETQGYLFRSRRVGGLGYVKRGIEGVAAFWSPYGDILVADEENDEEIIGMLTRYRLVFGDMFEEEPSSSSRSEVGMWKADEFTCFDKFDGDCSIVVLYCENNKFKPLEMEIGFIEDDLLSMFEKNLKKGVDHNQDTVSWYLGRIGTCYGQISVERAWCEERDERMGRGVFDVEGGSRVDFDEDFMDLDYLVRRQKSRIQSGRTMQGGARVRELRKKGGRGKRKRKM